MERTFLRWKAVGMPEARSGRVRPRVPRTKIVVPELPARMVSRARLWTELDRAQDSAVTLVQAPAGFGKTLLLAEWVRRGHSSDTAWVSLDSDDNDDRRFWSAVLAALDACPAIPPDNPLRELVLPALPSTDPGFLAEIVDVLDGLPSPVRLVLDDLHELTAVEPLQGTETLIRFQPAGLRMVLLSRFGPRLPLARLRLSGQMREVRAEELQFTMDEADALLGAAGVGLLAGQIRQLVQCTGGWAAALRLAAQALTETDAPEQFLADRTGIDRAVAGYLIDEVLSWLPDAKQEFLRTISGCEEVSASLAAAVSGQADAGEMLGCLERETALVVSTGTGRRWYRVHALLRSHLHADLQRQAPGRAATLHGKTADWLAAHQRTSQAMAHACLAVDRERVGDLLRHNALPLVLTGEHVVLRRAVAVLGDESFADEPWPALITALLHLESGEPAAASADLARAGAIRPAGQTPELESLRQFVCSCLTQFAGGIDDMSRITESPTSPAGNAPAVDALAKLHQGTVLLHAGHRARARELLQAALADARRNGYDYLSAQCLTILGRIAAAEGDFRLMNELATTVDSRLAGGLPAKTAGMAARLLLAYGALLRADPAECLYQTARAADLFDAGAPPASLLMHTLRGAAQFDTGDRSAGLRQMREARLNAAGGHFAPDEVALAAVVEHRAATLLGWGGVAGAVVRWVSEVIPASGELLLIRARTQAASHRYGTARAVLQPLLDGFAHPLLPWSIVEARLLETEIALRTAQATQARRALRTALSLAAPMDALYPVVFAAHEVIELLIGLIGGLGAEEDFARRVLAARSLIGVQSAPISLTDRERGVLRLLPTQRSFAEIAQDLTVSPNTVKTHVRAIYTKLGVGTRRDALAVAVDQGLIEAPSWTAGLRAAR
ncbi:LuxR family maltose regulon positive regulatory protein [Kibdelosporangium banguiense]|uniref:LuxR family maltose regulon positive regulatory protein n=1 Tax=Kibdelosporangium banguiense TaxID=1365924 RepID=A0ABS4TGE8_9PSEU|nr:LuxR C-terminal-related transcriptional regulator [Kibdelosporangium banguiense]MBP2323497.1 LuxR family maltose regulon positive regulatory protein [Kibdelosporangium banguiense]